MSGGSTTQLVGPKLGSLGKIKSKAEFNFDGLENEIESNGSRWAWSRATMCPCRGTKGSALDRAGESQASQPDLNCTLCKRTGVLYFRPDNYSVPIDAGTLDAVQTAIVAADAVVIRGVATSVQSELKFTEPMGEWLLGKAFISVRPDNRLGHWDRLTQLDAEVPFAELVKQGADSTRLDLRYLATCVNLLRSLTQVYYYDTHFDLVDGVLTWRTGVAPATGTTLSAHYLCHPTWIIQEQTKIVREATRAFKVRGTLKTPSGNPAPLPTQALMALEYLT